MLIKRNKKTSAVVFVVVFVIVFYYLLRVTSLVTLNDETWKLDFFSTALNDLYKLNTPIVITSRNLMIATMGSLFVLMIIETYRMQNKRNVQENTYGSAEWKTASDIKEKRDKNYENNIILTETELVSKNMKKSGMNRHVILIGRPGTRQIKILF